MQKNEDALKTNAPRGRTVSGGLKENLANNREETLRWVEAVPLRLVAAALLDAPRRTAKVGEIKDALTAEVIESGNWNRWWNLVRLRMRDSRHFSYVDRKPIRLRASNLAEVDSSSLDELRASARVSMNGADKSSASAAPAQSVSASGDAGKSRKDAAPVPDIAGLGGWVLWVQADEGEEQPLPKSVPPAQFATVLGKQPKALAGRAISRITSGIEQRVVESNNPSDKTIESWQESLVAALNRLSRLPNPQDVSIREAVLITARVLDERGKSQFQDVAAWMAAYASSGDHAVRTMSDAILSASRVTPLGADRLLGRLSKLMDSPVRKDLWLELMQSGLTMRRDAGLLEKWLGMLKSEERADAITYLLGAVQDGDTVKVVDSMLRTEWAKSGASQRARLSDAVALIWQSQPSEPSRNGFALNSAKPTAQMGAWLKVLDPDERYGVISHLIRAGADEGMIEAIGPVLQSERRAADDDKRHSLFDAAALGWALHEGLRPKALEVMREALLDLVRNGATRQDSRLSELAGIVEEASREEVERVRMEKYRELADRERELANTRAELESTERRRDFLQREIRTKRQDAELEITRDAITVLGIALQELAASPNPKSVEISDVEARITLALSTLGVKSVGEIGETVAFDSRLHEADHPQTQGTSVKVIAPGMQFSRRKDNPLNVVKMQVKA